MSSTKIRLMISNFLVHIFLFLGNNQLSENRNFALPTEIKNAKRYSDSISF